MKLYYVVASSDVEKFDTGEARVYTITTTNEQALQYIDKYVYIDVYGEFLQWCILNDKDAKNELSYNEYMEKVLIPNKKFSKFAILSAETSTELLVSALRIYFGCTPVGMSYESDVEKEILGAVEDSLFGANISEEEPVEDKEDEEDSQVC